MVRQIHIMFFYTWQHSADVDSCCFLQTREAIYPTSRIEAPMVAADLPPGRAEAKLG